MCKTRGRTSREQHLGDKNDVEPQDENRLLRLFEFAVQLSQKYGPVFSLRRGNERMVYITGHKMVKEALVNQLDSFVERPVVPLFHVVFKGIGGFWRADASSHSALFLVSVCKLLKLIRPTSLCVFNIQYLNIHAGIALSNGYMWKKQRKFANTHLRYFGEGQKSLENYIQVESNFLCDSFKDEQGK